MTSPLQFNDSPTPLTNQQPSVVNTQSTASHNENNLSTETKIQLETLAYIRKMSDDIRWMKQSQQRQIYVKYATYFIIAFITIWSIYATISIAKSFIPQYQKVSNLSDTLDKVNVSKSGVNDILETFLK